MRAVALPHAHPLAPFGEPAATLPVLGATLREAQEAALAGAGLTLGEDDPSAPRLVFGSHTWFTRTLVERLVASGKTGRLVVRDPTWLHHVSPLAADAAHPTIGVVPAGRPASDLVLLDELEIDGGFEPMKTIDDHPALAHAQPALVSGVAVAHDVEHWAHLVRLNGIALAALGRERQAEFVRAPWWRKVLVALGVLLRAGRLREAEVLGALTRKGKRPKLHPTAVVEACELGDDVEVGPGAVLRGVVVGNGAKIEAMAHVVASSVGPRARVGRQTHLAMCVLAEGAYVSAGVGHQATIFGRDSFTALGVCTFDLSFGQVISVETPEGRASAGTWFLGSAIGHRAKIGAGVRLGYGVAVPNDAFLVAPAADVLRRWPEPVSGPVTVDKGTAVAVKRRES